MGYGINLHINWCRFLFHQQYLQLGATRPMLLMIAIRWSASSKTSLREKVSSTPWHSPDEVSWTYANIKIWYVRIYKYVEGEAKWSLPMRVIFYGKPVEVVITHGPLRLDGWKMCHAVVPLRDVPPKWYMTRTVVGLAVHWHMRQLWMWMMLWKCLRSQCYWGVINFDHLHHYPHEYLDVVHRWSFVVHLFIHELKLLNSFINAYTIIYIHNMTYIPTYMHTYMHAVDLRCILYTFIMYIVELNAQECAIRHIWWYI